MADLNIALVILMILLVNLGQSSSFTLSHSNSRLIASLSCNRVVKMSSSKTSNDFATTVKKYSKFIATSFIAINLMSNYNLSPAYADDAASETPAVTIASTSTTNAKKSDIPLIPLYTKKGTDTQVYTDIGRGFRMLR